VITTIEEFVDPVASARTVPMTLRPGAIRAEWVRVDLGDVLLEIGDYSFPIATRGETLRDRLVVLAPLHRIISGHMNGAAVTPGLLHTWGEAAEVAGATTGPMRFGIVSFTRRTLDQSAQDLGIELDVPGRGEFRAVLAADWAHLSEAFDTVLRMVTADPAAAPSEREAADVSAQLLDGVVRSFAAGRDHASLDPRTRLSSVHIARACQDRAIQMRYQGVTLADLCVASGSSERRVRDAFYECYAMSPMAYLRVAALHEVRHALLRSPRGRDPVSRAASDFGFWHLSRFAGQYRALFGESPSTTLDRRTEATAG
jgi:AraC-like DNA-binding protein